MFSILENFHYKEFSGKQKILRNNGAAGVLSKNRSENPVVTNEYQRNNTHSDFVLLSYLCIC